MTDTKTIDVWVVVQKSTGQMVMWSIAKTKSGAKTKFNTGYTWDNRRWKIVPATITIKE